MKFKLLLVFSIILGIGFTGCSKTPTPKYMPYDVNNKYIRFYEGKAYRTPYRTRGMLLAEFSKPIEDINVTDTVEIFKKLGNVSCNEKSLMWIESKYVDKYFNNPSEANIKIHNETIFKDSPCPIPIPAHLYDTPEKEAKLIEKCGDGNRYGQSSNQYKIIVAMQQGFAGCVDELSDREFEYYVGKEKQEDALRKQLLQLQNDRDIQSRKDLQQTLDRLNDSTNNNTPKSVFIY